MINLDHADTWSNINEEIGVQIFMINLHKFFLALEIGKGFVLDCLSKPFAINVEMSYQMKPQSNIFLFMQHDVVIRPPKYAMCKQNL